jgi:hypothetical protein
MIDIGESAYCGTSTPAHTPLSIAEARLAEEKRRRRLYAQRYYDEVDSSCKLATSIISALPFAFLGLAIVVMELLKR